MIGFIDSSLKIYLPKNTLCLPNRWVIEFYNLNMLLLAHRFLSSGVGFHEQGSRIVILVCTSNIVLLKNSWSKENPSSTLNHDFCFYLSELKHSKFTQPWRLSEIILSIKVSFHLNYFSAVDSTFISCGAILHQNLDKFPSDRLPMICLKVLSNTPIFFCTFCTYTDINF